MSFVILFSTNALHQAAELLVLNLCLHVCILAQYLIQFQYMSWDITQCCSCVSLLILCITHAIHATAFLDAT